MELIFNELSTKPSLDSIEIANIKILQLIRAFARAKRENGYRIIRFPVYFSEVTLSDGYTLQDWFLSTRCKNEKNLLLGAFQSPYIPDDNVVEQEEYLEHRYFFEDQEGGITRSECEGLATAHIYSTLSLSLSTSGAWEKNSLELERLRDRDQFLDTVEVKNIYSEQCLDDVEIRSYIEARSNIELVKSEIDPLRKKKHFREDHGKNVLDAFAEKLFMNPYVESVINSIPFNPRFPEFILRVFDSGIIYLVLHWRDEGYGLAVKTTGRNMRETRAIADILKREFDS